MKTVVRTGAGSMFLSLAQVAERLGLPRKTVYRLYRRGDLPGVTLGTRNVRVPVRALETWLAQIDQRALAHCKEVDGGPA
jgi:excisionase family DNA binding protein